MTNNYHANTFLLWKYKKVDNIFHEENYFIRTVYYSKKYYNITVQDKLKT